MNWIKTSERLPGSEKIPGTLIDSNRSANVLAFYNGDIRVLFYNHQHEYWDDENDSCFDCDNNDIEYWMPLPPKPIKPSTKAIGFIIWLETNNIPFKMQGSIIEFDLALLSDSQKEECSKIIHKK